jgi:hypothetical protein
MTDRPPRLGDVVDDYCPRCRLLLNHDVASLYSGAVAKVTCRTCHNTHDYRHAQVPTRRKKAAGGVDKQKLMEEVLAGMGRPASGPPPAAVPPPAAPPPAPPPSPAAAAAPVPRKRRDLWAELDRIRQKK